MLLVKIVLPSHPELKHQQNAYHVSYTMNTPLEIEQLLADFAITTHILGALKTNPQIPVSGVEVITRNGCVTLIGQLQWDFQVDIVNSLVEKIVGVKELNNYIAVTPAARNNSIWSFSAN